MAVSLAALTGCGRTGNSVQGYADGLDIEQAGDVLDRDVLEAAGGMKSAAIELQKPEEALSAENTRQPEEELSTENTGQPKEEPSTESASQEEPGRSAEPGPVITPILPSTGRSLADFVPEGWQLLDSVELDFNGDGIADYVGVQEADRDIDEEVWNYPRILFAVASDGTGQYRLDFQNENLIRTCDEGGAFGDPYQSMTVEGAAFSTHSYGGSAWRWAEDYTYEYMEGTWYLTLAEEIYAYGGYITEYSLNDWKRGIGIRGRRSSEFSDMEKHWNEDNPEYDLVYELTLDKMPTLCQAGTNWWFAANQVEDWEVNSVEFAEGIELADDPAEYLTQNAWFDYNDGDCALYQFKSENGSDYIAMYRWQDKKLIVVAEIDSGAACLNLYKDKIYYVSRIMEEIKYRSVEAGKEAVEEKDYAVGVRLNRVNVDGTGLETVFEYRYPGTEQDILDKCPPYLSITYEIGRDEIVLEVYIGGEPHPFYRMNPDGTGLEKIGQVPKE